MDKKHLIDQTLIYDIPLIEAGVTVTDVPKKKVNMSLIKSGRSQRGNYYSDEVLEEAAPKFSGIKMYIDHPDEKDLGKPRSLRDWAATILESKWDPTKHSIDATVGIRDDWLWNKVQTGKEEGWLN